MLTWRASEVRGRRYTGKPRTADKPGDDRNALLMVNVEAVFGPGAPPVTLPGARLYLIDGNGKIVSEQVVFMVPD